MRKTLTDKGVAALRPTAQRYAFPDPELRGHYVRVQPSGAKSFVTVTVNPNKKQIWTTLGDCNVLTIVDAREKAREIIQRVKAGLAAIPEAAETFQAVAERWLARHVAAKGLRSEREIRRLLARHVFPAWGNRGFVEIRRSDVANLLDEVEDDNGARQADAVLTVVRSIMNWHATRTDDYGPPIVKGMRRQSVKAQARSRILNDDELRAVWTAAETGGLFGDVVRLLLLTAQRRFKVTAMRWSEVTIDGIWTIPTEPREKGNAGVLVLPEIARNIIASRHRLSSNPFVFAVRSTGPFNGYPIAKREFDKRLPDVAPWVVHDLRRTARSLMARAGVRPEIAERVLGHVQTGVQGVYDRHEYRDEKADALQRLANLIDGIVHPRENVTALQRRA